MQHVWTGLLQLCLAASRFGSGRGVQRQGHGAARADVLRRAHEHAHGGCRRLNRAHGCMVLSQAPAPSPAGASSAMRGVR